MSTISSLVIVVFIFFFNFSLLLHGKPQPHIIFKDTIHNHAVYIIHVQCPVSTKFHLFKHRKAWYKSFLPNSTLASGETRLVYAYRMVISGFAAWLTKEELKTMESMSGFLISHRDRELEFRTTYTPEFLGLRINGGMWFNSIYGQGTIIAVIDSGVKPTHPSFRDQAMPPAPKKWNGTCYWVDVPPLCNNKIIGAKSFNWGGGSPLDKTGHGTSVASVAAGNFVFNDAEFLGNARGTASGIAPKSHLAIYQARSSTQILRAFEEAIRNNVDVISISVEDYFPNFYKNNIIIGSFLAAHKGIVPCAAAPNSGPTKNLIDNDAPWIITVGASSTDRRIMATVKLGDDREFEGESAYQPSDYNSSQLPLLSGIPCNSKLLKNKDVKGKIVLCKPDGITAGLYVLKAGGKAMIILGNKGNTTYAQPHLLPASYVTKYAGEQVIKYATTVNSTAAILFRGTQFGARPSPAVATFSGRGPSRNNGGIIKPDVIAPGSNILVAWPFKSGLNDTERTLTFRFKSGTSLATPHVAGLVALLKHNHPTWSFAAIKSAIMTTARVKDLDGNPMEDQSNGKPASVFAMGSGIIDPTAANDPGIIYDSNARDYIYYLCGSGKFNDNEVAAIINTKRNINCSALVPAPKVEDLNYPSIQVSLSEATPSKIVRRIVTKVGDVGTTYTVSFEEPNGVNIVVSPLVLTFNSVGENKIFNVTLSYKTIPLPAGQISEGQLSWNAGKYLARIPIAVEFA